MKQIVQSFIESFGFSTNKLYFHATQKLFEIFDLHFQFFLDNEDFFFYFSQSSFLKNLFSYFKIEKYGICISIKKKKNEEILQISLNSAGI